LNSSTKGNQINKYIVSLKESFEEKEMSTQVKMTAENFRGIIV
jgi:hypothetical protein